jgi:DHA2 family multidrug resistance protein
LQLMLDRGRRLDWFNSTEICIEATIAVLAFYLLIVHTFTATDRSFLSRELLKSPNFVTGTMLMFLIGGILSGTLALIPTMLQHLMHYPVMTTGLVTATRGFGTMAAMFLVGRLIGKVDERLLIFFGLALTAASLWLMTGFSLQMGMQPVILSGLLQGFGLGCTFVPLNTIALSTLPRELLTQGTALRSLVRNVGGSMGIAILVGQLTTNVQVVHSRLVEHLRPDNPLAQAPLLAPRFSLTNPSGIAALNAEVTRQAEMIAYINDFAMMMTLVLLAVPVLLLVRRQRPPAAE